MEELLCFPFCFVHERVEFPARNRRKTWSLMMKRAATSPPFSSRRLMTALTSPEWWNGVIFIQKKPIKAWRTLVWIVLCFPAPFTTCYSLLQSHAAQTFYNLQPSDLFLQADTWTLALRFPEKLKKEARKFILFLGLSNMLKKKKDPKTWKIIVKS